MATLTSKAELKSYVKRRLGDPVIEINVSDDQLDDAVDYSLQKFQQFHYDGCERVWKSAKSAEAATVALRVANVIVSA